MIKHTFQISSIKDVCILDPHAVEASTKGGKAEKLISNKVWFLKHMCMLVMKSGEMRARGMSWVFVTGW